MKDLYDAGCKELIGRKPRVVAGCPPVFLVLGWVKPGPHIGGHRSCQWKTKLNADVNSDHLNSELVRTCYDMFHRPSETICTTKRWATHNEEGVNFVVPRGRNIGLRIEDFSV